MFFFPSPFSLSTGKTTLIVAYKHKIVLSAFKKTEIIHFHLKLNIKNQYSQPQKPS